MALTMTISPKLTLMGMWRSHHSGHSHVDVALCRFRDCDLDATTELNRVPLCALHLSLLHVEADQSPAAL